MTDQKSVVTRRIPKRILATGIPLFIVLTLIAVVSGVFLGRKSPKKRFFTKQGEGT
jgi:hypothetical protein